MTPILSCLIAMFCQLPDSSMVEGGAPVDPKVEWGQVELWKSDTLSARLLFKPKVSVADKIWFMLELENHTQQPIELGQTWISLRSASKDNGESKSECRMSLSGTMRSIKSVPPGRHRYDGDTLRYAPTNTVCKVDATRVDVLAEINTKTNSGQSFETAKGTTFSFEWRQPTAEQLRLMSAEFKKHLAAGTTADENYGRGLSLLRVPAVVETLTVDDYLSALKQTRDWVPRHMLLELLFVRHANDPKVLEYYREMFEQDPDFTCQDAMVQNAWNKEFLEPLVQGCEQGYWGCFTGLSRHAPAWRNDYDAVSRVSVVLLNHHAILQRDVKDIPENKLAEWARAVQDASSVPDPKIVDLLKVALDDQRGADIDLGSGGIDHARVCDRAVDAIVKILDGEWWPAFKAAGITGWRTKAERESAYDRMIEILKVRLKSEPTQSQRSKFLETPRKTDTRHFKYGRNEKKE